MCRRNPPPHRSGGVRPGAVAVVVALGMALTGAIAPPISRAEPAPDLERARELYRSAEAAMQDGRYDDATRDYGAAYELSADPALLYKIGRASERAGKCDVALGYYARYLRDGKPTEQFTALTRERIAACGGDRAGSASPGPGEAGEPTAAAPRPPDATPDATQGGAAATAATGSAGGAAPPEGPAGPAAASGAGAAALIPPTREKIAWLVGGGAIALATLGGVLAYAASSSESDVRDLYAGFGGQAPPFDAPTRRRYDDLVDEGRRYQHLSWAAFGLAGAAAVGVAVLFAVGRGDEPAPAVTPVVGAHAAGVSVRF
jgi:tetratricopeptide (TPR) repeat protein